MSKPDIPINRIVVRDCADEIWSDTWALDLGSETIAYVQGEDLASVLAVIFNPETDPLNLLDVLILLMHAGLQLAKDFERLRKETGQ